MNLNSLDALLIEELRDIYDAEHRIISALPAMSKAATDSDLKDTFDTHLEETKNHIERLHRVFDTMGAVPNDHTCHAARGLIRESEQIIDSPGDGAVKDAALIGAAQRVEHYEMAAYGTACALAKQLELDEVAGILHETLEEEEAVDKKLTHLAMGSFFSSGINDEACEDATA